jgi:hypothetical protein
MRGALRDAMTTLATARRPMRTCERCGRVGYKAFEAVPGTTPAWRCAHEGPCDARRRSLIRVGARERTGRPKSSPLMAVVAEDEPIALVASRRSEAEALAVWLRDHTPLVVDVLDFSYRSMARLARMTYSLCVVDARATDPLAGCNELARRLSASSRSRQPILVVAGSERDLRGPIRELASRPNARVVAREAGPDGLRSVIDVLVGGGSSGSALTA